MMRCGKRVGLALMLAWCHLCGLAQPLKALAYVGWWQPQSWQSVPLHEMERLFFFELQVDASGAVSERHGWPEQWQDLQAAAKAHRVPVDLTLTLFDSGTFNRLFASDQAIAKLLADCLELARPQGVSGLHFDFEIYKLI